MIGFKTRLYIGFTLAIVLSAVSGLTSYRIFKKQAAQRIWVKQARAIVDSARSIQNLMVDMETGRRGFRATKELQFLEPYYVAVQHIDPSISGLKSLLAEYPEQKSRAELLEQHIHSLIRFWENNGDDTARYDQEVIAKRTNDEKKQMDSIRGIATELQKDENKLLNKRREEYDALIHDAALSSGIDSIICETIILILVFFIFREFRKRRKVQEQLNKSVDDLKDQAAVLQSSKEELKNALEEVGKINKQLEKFVYTVAHDIKSPLAGISGALSILQSDEVIAGNPELTEFINLSAERAVHLSEMVNSILEYSRVSLDQQQVDVVNTKELVEEIAALMFPPQHMQIVVADKMPVFKTKRIKIMEVFQNLISNAIKYNDKKQGRIEIGYRDKNADYYEFYVKDNGTGILSENIPLIFTLFRTNNTYARESSTGFGLNIVKLVVEEQGGKIWVDSVPGEGSTFYFEWKK